MNPRLAWEAVQTKSAAYSIRIVTRDLLAQPYPSTQARFQDRRCSGRSRAGIFQITLDGSPHPIARYTYRVNLERVSSSGDGDRVQDVPELAGLHSDGVDDDVGPLQLGSDHVSLIFEPTSTPMRGEQEKSESTPDIFQEYYTPSVRQITLNAADGC